MEPRDKFGNPIYSHVYRKLQGEGQKLTALGYSESKYKPNLFLCKYRTAVFFADMRGTDEIPIWTYPVPLFYWSWLKQDLELKTRQKAVYIEWSRVVQKVELRLATLMDDDSGIESTLITGALYDEFEDA